MSVMMINIEIRDALTRRLAIDDDENGGYYAGLRRDDREVLENALKVLIHDYEFLQRWIPE